jgi:hypothetical protein
MLWIAKDRRTLLTAVSFALAMIAAMFLMVVPLYTSVRQDASGWHMTHQTLLEVNGVRGIILPVLLPVAATLLPVLCRNQVLRIVAIILTGGIVVLGILSIGNFYVPAVITMLVAVTAKPLSPE